MIFDLTRLKNKLENCVPIDMEYEFKKEELVATELMAPFKISLKGSITRDSFEGFDLTVTVKGTMTLPCSVTLKPVLIPLEIKIEGNLEELIEEIDEKQKKIENSIDILPIIWENILMEIPMKVTSNDAYSKNIEGNGWKLVTEKKEEPGNHALEQLKDLL